MPMPLGPYSFSHSNESDYEENNNVKVPTKGKKHVRKMNCWKRNVMKARRHKGENYQKTVTLSLPES